MGKNVKVDLSGLEKLQRKLKEVEGEHTYQMSEMFPDSFMRKNSKYMDIDSFFNDVGVFNEEDFNSIDESKLDNFVKLNSNFDNWNEMKVEAAAELMKKKLGLD